MLDGEGHVMELINYILHSFILAEQTIAHWEHWGGGPVVVINIWKCFSVN